MLTLLFDYSNVNLSRLKENELVVAIYVACIIVSIILCFWYFLVDVRRSIVQNCMLLAMTVANIGYFMLATAKDLTGVIVSQKVVYIGAIYLPLLFSMTVCELCHIRIKPITKFILAAIQTLIFGLVCTIGYSSIYYKDVGFIVDDGITKIVKVYGPLHFLHPLFMYTYLIGSIIFAIITLFKTKSVDAHEIIMLIVCQFISGFTYVMQTPLGLPFDITPVVYIVMMTGCLVPIYHTDIYNVVENANVITEQLSKVGFITFDRHLQFRGANDYAVSLFKEMKDARAGVTLKPIPDKFARTLQEIGSFLEDRKLTNEHKRLPGSNIKIGRRTYSTAYHTLHDFLGNCVGVTVELRDITEHARVLELTERYNSELANEVEQKTAKIRDIQEKTILGIAQMVESRDTSTGGHIKRTSDVVRIFAKKLLKSKLGYTKRFLDLVVRSAPMHDIGKIGVDDAVLRKQGKFTPEEYDIMRKHTEIGGKMVKDILNGVEEEDFVTVAYNVASYHHEKVNGRGYPRGLSGDEIPVEARIMALADVFDALVSKRCYKVAFTFDEAFGIIENDAGTHFDKDLAKVFLSCRRELEEYYNSVEH